MATARRAYLDALLGRKARVLEGVALYAAAPAGAAAPFLDAWDAVFLGWALSIAGEGDAAVGRLSAAGDFFRRASLEAAAADSPADPWRAC